jgi:hypothetical protein
MLDHANVGKGGRNGTTTEISRAATTRGGGS